MRSHTDIIKDAGGPHAVARLLAEKIETDLPTLESRVRGWNLSKSIPGEYWPLLEALGVASLSEFAVAAASRKGIPSPQHSEAA